MSSSKSPAALWIVVILLLIVGAALRYGISGITDDVAPAPSRAAVKQTSRPGGASPSAIDPSASIAAAREAISASNAAALKDAIRDLDVNGQYPLIDSGRRQMTLLTFAAIQPGPQMVTALLEAGAKPDVPSDGGVTPLMMAAARSDAAAIAALTAAGAQVNARDKWGQTALIYAARAGAAPNVRSLLAAGAGVALADNEGATALSCAAGLGGTPDTVDALLKAGADAETPNKDGVTPLMRAAECGDHAKCAMLLSAGARPGVKDSSGLTAFDWAKLRNDEPGERCAQFLAQAGN